MPTPQTPRRPHRIETQTTATHTLLGNTIPRLTLAITHLTAQTPDGYGNGGTGGPRGSDISDPTLQAVARRIHPNENTYGPADEYARLEFLVTQLVDDTAALHEQVTRLMPPATSIDTARYRCSGSVTPDCQNLRGDWTGDRTTNNHLDRPGLCDECLKHACPSCIDRGVTPRHTAVPTRKLRSGKPGCEACVKWERRHEGEAA